MIQKCKNKFHIGDTLVECNHGYKVKVISLGVNTYSLHYPDGDILGPYPNFRILDQEYVHKHYKMNLKRILQKL